VVVVLSGHELVHKFVRSLYDFVDFFYLFLLYLFVSAVKYLLVLAVFLNWSPEGIGKRIIVWFLYRRIIKGKCQRLDIVHVRKDVHVFTS